MGSGFIKNKAGYPLLFILSISILLISILISGCAKQADVKKCPSGLQSCGKGCIPTNAVCCDDDNINSYCLQPTSGCSDKNCNKCPPGEVFCGMLCVAEGAKCCIGECPKDKPSNGTSPSNEKESDYVSVHIDSVDCRILSRRSDNRENGVVQLIAKGNAIGPLNVYLYVPQWAEEFDCGAWTREPNTYAKTCIRMKGDPETTDWSATSENIDTSLTDVSGLTAQASVDTIDGSGHMSDLLTVVDCSDV